MRSPTPLDPGFRYSDQGPRILGRSLRLREFTMPDPRSWIPDAGFAIPGSGPPDPISPIPDPKIPDPRPESTAMRADGRDGSRLRMRSPTPLDPGLRYSDQGPPTWDRASGSVSSRFRIHDPGSRMRDPLSRNPGPPIRYPGSRTIRSRIPDPASRIWAPGLTYACELGLSCKR